MEERRAQEIEEHLANLKPLFFTEQTCATNGEVPSGKTQSRRLLRVKSREQLAERRGGCWSPAIS